MSDTVVRAIRGEGSAVIVETTDPEGGHSTMEFGMVKILSNGWIECEPIEEDSAPKRFFPPSGVKAVVVEDEQKVSGTW